MNLKFHLSEIQNEANRKLLDDSSSIREEVAKKREVAENLQRELPDYNLQALAEKGRQIWDKALSDIQVEGGSDTDKQISGT